MMFMCYVAEISAEIICPAPKIRLVMYQARPEP